jgi:hypothetical protein
MALRLARPRPRPLRAGQLAGPCTWSSRWGPVVPSGVARWAEPADADAFKANLGAYTKQLQSLDAEVERQINSLANKKVVTNHDVFGYYIDRYGLEFVGSIIPSFDTSTELSGSDIRDLVAESVREAEQPSEPYESGFPY